MIKYIPDDALMLYNGELSSVLHFKPHQFVFTTHDSNKIYVGHQLVERFSEMDEIYLIQFIEREYGKPWRIHSDFVDIFSKDSNFYD